MLSSYFYHLSSQSDIILLTKDLKRKKKMLTDLRKSFWKYLKDVLAFIDFINITGTHCHTFAFSKHLWNICYDMGSVPCPWDF